MKDLDIKSSEVLDLETTRIIEHGREVVELELKALKKLVKLIDRPFVEVVNLILNCKKTKGKLVFSGIGKAGIVAQKVGSTFSSLGRSSFFMHPAEASHGDLGMVGKNDLVFFFSNSGNSKEVTSLIPSIKKIGSTTIAITGKKDSYLYQNVDYPLYYGKVQEACGLGLAPTTSTTTMLALGDALAVAVLKEDRSFDERSFAFFHPGGSLGKKLMYVKELMRQDEEVVKVFEDEETRNVLVKMTQARIGIAVVMRKNRIRGIFSDGDLRRGLKQENVLDLPIKVLMTSLPTLIKGDQYVSEAIEIMTTKKIGELPVISNDQTFLGVICLKDLV